MRGSNFYFLALAAFALTMPAADLTSGFAQTQGQRVAAEKKKPHVPPWSVSRPPVPSQSAPITPGGTFQRPATTFSTPAGSFSTPAGSFSRPGSTFSHPGSSYTPLKPVRPGHPGLEPNYGYYPPPPVIYSETVIYEPYFIPADGAVQAPVESAGAPAVTETAPPMVLDLPPGAVVRKAGTVAPSVTPATTAAPTPAAPVAAAKVAPAPATP